MATKGQKQKRISEELILKIVKEKKNNRTIVTINYNSRCSFWHN